MAICTQCRADDDEWPCADFLQEPGGPTGKCVCGHSKSQHVPPLPPKGACPAQACRGFVGPVNENLTPRTCCAAIVGHGSEHCGAPYTSHLNLLPPVTSTRGLPAPANVPAQRGTTEAVTPWHPPAISNSTRSALTTNECQVASYQQAGHPGISKLTPLPATVLSSKAKGKGKAVVEMTFDIVILPECCDGGNDETANETGSNAYSVADAIIVKQTDSLCLTIDIRKNTLGPESPETPPKSLGFSGFPEILKDFQRFSKQLRATIGKYGWYVVDTITKPCKDGHTRKPFEFNNKHALALNTSSFFERTNLKNYLNTTTKVHSYLQSGRLSIHLCPSESPMYLQGHPCVEFKLLYEWTIQYRLYHEDPEDPQVQCLPLCPSERTHILHHLFSKKSCSVNDLPDPNVPLLRGPLEQLGVDNEDDRDIQAGLLEPITSPQSLDADAFEAANIARAIALSMQDQVDPLSARQVSTGYDEFSSAGAGPSRAVGSISAPASLPLAIAARRTRSLSPNNEVVFLPSDTVGFFCCVGPYFIY
ncbi:hypothetical protein FB446DRAFT_709576 [Lentinula raphanica]|nr:hypothetical protein FB446DRAFT_709576 [Lentinula raphanica]